MTSGSSVSRREIASYSGFGSCCCCCRKRYAWQAVCAIQLAGTTAVVDDHPVASAAMFGMHEQRTLRSPAGVADSVQIDSAAVCAVGSSAASLVRSKFLALSRICMWLARYCLKTRPNGSMNAISSSPSNRAIEKSVDGDASADGRSTIDQGTEGSAWQSAITDFRLAG